MANTPLTAEQVVALDAAFKIATEIGGFRWNNVGPFSVGGLLNEVVTNIDDGTFGPFPEVDAALFKNGTTSILLKSYMADGASAVAAIVNTSTAWANAGAKLQQWKNNGTEKAYIDGSGNAVFNSVNVGQGLWGNNNAPLTFVSAKTDGATAVGFNLTTQALSTPGAKILSVNNNTSEVLQIDKDGIIKNASGYCYLNLDQYNQTTLYGYNNISLTSVGRITLGGTHVYMNAEAEATSAAFTSVPATTGFAAVANGALRRGMLKITVDYRAWSAANGGTTTQDLTLGVIPAKARVVSVIADTTVAYAASGIASAAIILGKTAGGNQYLLTHDVMTAPIARGLVDGDLGASISRANAVQGGDIPSWSAGTNLSARLTTTGANINTLSAGSTTFYVTIETF